MTSEEYKRGISLGYATIAKDIGLTKDDVRFTFKNGMEIKA